MAKAAIKIGKADLKKVFATEAGRRQLPARKTPYFVPKDRPGQQWQLGFEKLPHLEAWVIRWQRKDRSGYTVRRVGTPAPLGMRNTSLGLRDDLSSRFCPVKVSYTDIPALLPPEAVEGLGAVLAMPGGELPGGGCVSTVGDVHRFAEMLRRGGELDGARILCPGMIDFCTQNQTGDKRNILFDMWRGTRNWLAYPANIGVGFFLRGEGNLPGLFSVMNSPRTYGGFGAGSTGFTVDPERDLTLAFLSTGLMEDSYHFERIGEIATLVMAALIE